MTERLTRLIGLATRLFVHPRRRIEALLAQPTLEAQREFYDREWNTRRWRALLRVLGNRHLFRLAYTPAGFHHDQSLDPAAYFARVFEHAVTALPVANNYFLHQVFLGRYPHAPDGLPPYLAHATLERLRENLCGLAFVDGSYTAHLRRCPPRSIDGFALSNICEWMTPLAIDELFAEIVRTAAPGAIVCFRNNFAHTDVPEHMQHLVAEDRARSAEMSRRDRSIVTPRFAVCHVAGNARTVLDRYGHGPMRTPCRPRNAGNIPSPTTTDTSRHVPRTES
jgi:S-adenosylmethionine-diacylglycerol 3-amino-3-carboxypropyl transferase